MKVMNRRKALAITLTALMAMSAIAGCGQQENAATSENTATPTQNTKGTLRMATSADYPPYEFRDTASGKDEIIGFDVDIANYIAKELGYKLEVSDTDFNGLIPALQTKRVDLVMAGMTPTEERKKNVDFSDIYYEAKNTLVAKKGTNFTKLEDLAGKRVGVQLGSTQETAIKDASKTIKGINMVSLNKIGEIIEEIKSNRIEAAVIEDTVAKGYTANNADLVFNTIPSNPQEAGSAIAFPKGSEQVAGFNKVIRQMKENGELEKLAKKWFEKK